MINSQLLIFICNYYSLIINNSPFRERGGGKRELSHSFTMGITFHEFERVFFMDIELYHFVYSMQALRFVLGLNPKNTRKN